MKNKGTIGFVLWLGIVAAILGTIFLWSRNMMNESDKFGFCLDVIYNQITTDSQTVTDCQKIVKNQREEWDKRDIKRNQKFLDKIERNNLTIPGK